MRYAFTGLGTKHHALGNNEFTFCHPRYQRQVGLLAWAAFLFTSFSQKKKMLTWICDRYNNIIFRNSYQHWKSFADTESSTSKLYSLHHLYLCQCVSQLKRWIGDLTDLIQADTSAVTERVRTWAEVRGENLGCKLTSYTSFGRCWLESTIIIHNW